MYRHNNAGAEGEVTNETPRDLNEMMQAMQVGGTDAVELDEVVAAFRRRLNLTDPSILNGLAEEFMKRASVSASQSQEGPREETISKNGNSDSKENEPKPSAAADGYATPTECRPPRDDSTPFDEDVTPTTNNATPMSFATKTPTPLARGRNRTISRSRSSRSRSRTPIGSLFRRGSPVPEGSDQSPARRTRSQSPFRRYFGSSGKPDVSPNNPRGAIPPPARSGLPPTPVRTEPINAETPTARTAESYPSPPSTAGNTFCSPTSSQSWTNTFCSPTPSQPWTPGPGSARGNFEANGGVHHNMTPVPQPDVNVGAQQRMASPEFNGVQQPNIPSTAAQFAANASAPSPEPVNVAQNPASQAPAPVFNVNLKKSKSERTRTKAGRRVSDKRAAKSGGPEGKSFAQSTPVDSAQQPVGATAQFASVPGLSRAFSVDSGLQQDGTSSSRIFISSPPSMQEQPAESMSPEEMDMSPENNDHPTNGAPAVQFNIGAGGKNLSHGTGRSRRNHPRKPGSPSRGSVVHRRHKGIFPRTSPAKTSKTPGSSDLHTNRSEESAESSGGQTLRTESTCSSEVDYTGRRALVSAMRDEARDAYTKHDFRTAVLKYTMALKVHVGELTAADEADDLRALLLANRAAALLMVDAYEAAGADCQAALKFVSDLNAVPAVLATDSGPALRAKLFARMGKALLRLGKLQEAEQAFYNTINTANATLAIAHQIGVSEVTEQTKRFLMQLITDAESGKIEVNRCREAAEAILKFGNTSAHSPTSSSRRISMQALLFVNKALEFAPGATSFHEKKVVLVASLKRWRELAGHCERLAASCTKFDGVLEGDLVQWNRFPGAQRAESLNSEFFDINDPAESSTKKLGNRAAAEAALRLPHGLLPFYLRALRLEERWSQASSAIEALDNFVQLTAGLSNHQSLQMKFAWLAREKDKLCRTSAGKDRGDSLFRNGDYQLAAAQYTSCLTIDAEGLPDPSLGEVSNAGGRLHAILHCNRAACLMAMKKYHVAVTDCTSALRIHSHYMKALLRRSRCYSRLERYEEATFDYNKWLQLVDMAKRSPDDPDLSTTPCLFDSPKDIASEEVEKVKQELQDVVRSKQMAENAARSEASFNASRRQWYQESFGRSDPGDAQQRREHWYSQKASSSRRWDSFAGRSPKREQKAEGSRQEQQQRSQSQNGFSGAGSSSSSYRQQRKVNVSPGSDPSLDHYAVLEIARNASDSQIKKAYRKMALKYHPDKNKAPEAADKFRRIKMAYETLNDTAARRKYDAEMLWTRRF